MYFLESLQGCFEYFFPCCCKKKMVYISFEFASDSDSESSSGKSANEEDTLITIDPVEELSDSDI